MSNWINLEIKEKKYYLLCKINDKNDWDCLLYDGNESWYENQKLETILARVKEQNRRIQYDEATIKETLQSGQPTEVTWPEADDNADDEEHTSKHLKLKYSVKSCPFHFTWHFTKQSEHDFQKFILFPLFRIVQGLTQQNKELRDIIRKKDVEVKQYKYEFGTLKRVTVSTQPFIPTDFDQRYAETLELSKCMMQISDLLKAQYSQMKTPIKTKMVDKVDDNDEATKSKEDVKLTPRRKRRKVIAEQQRIIAEKMQACIKGFAYESSQSQISSISQSDTEAVGSSKRLLRSPNKSEELKIINDLDETPTKRNKTQKPANDQSPVKPVKRNFNASLKYDDSSEEETEVNKSPNNEVKPSDKLTNEETNSSLSTRNRPNSSTAHKSPVKMSKISAVKDVAASAPLTRKNAGIYEFSDSSEDNIKLSKLANKHLSESAKQTSKSEQAARTKANSPSLTLNRSNGSTVETSSAKLVKKDSGIGSSIAGRLTRKNAGIVYEDSSESPAEEKSYKKTSSPLNATPTKNSNSKIIQSSEKLSDDVQNIIDEWKALEQRRLADLKQK